MYLAPQLQTTDETTYPGTKSRGERGAFKTLFHSNMAFDMQQAAHALLLLEYYLAN